MVGGLQVHEKQPWKGSWSPAGARMEELPPAAARPWQECDLLTQIRRPPFLLRGPTNPRANRSVSCIRHRLIPSHFLLLWTHSLIRARGKDHAKKSLPIQER